MNLLQAHHRPPWRCAGACSKRGFPNSPLVSCSFWRQASSLRLSFASRNARLGRLRAQFSSGGGGGGGGRNNAQSIVNIALTGAFVYLLLTGNLGWLFDAIFSLWLFLVIAPIAALVLYFWYLETQIQRGSCPNCGNEVQVLKFAVEGTPQQCPYCRQPFKVENAFFVRDASEFEDFLKNQDGGGIVVDVEAEVLDDN